MSSTKVRVNLKAYDHRLLDVAAGKIIETVKRTGGEVSGPVPLPTEIEKVTVLRAVHKYKDAREQFERRTHKRLIDIKNPSKETVDALSHLDLPSGVDINIKLSPSIFHCLNVFELSPVSNIFLLSIQTPKI